MVVHKWSFSLIEVSLESLIYFVASFFERANGHNKYAEFILLSRKYLKERQVASGCSSKSYFLVLEQKSSFQNRH